jgi:hypothetical protein
MNALFHWHRYNAAGRFKLKAQYCGVLSKVIRKPQNISKNISFPPSSHYSAWLPFLINSCVSLPPYSTEMNALFHRHCFNAAGRIKLKAQYPGVLSKVIPKVRQLFERVPCASVAAADDARFEYFTKQVRTSVWSSPSCGRFGKRIFAYIRLIVLERGRVVSKLRKSAVQKRQAAGDLADGRPHLPSDDQRFQKLQPRANLRLAVQGVRESPNSCLLLGRGEAHVCPVCMWL